MWRQGEGRAGRKGGTPGSKIVNHGKRRRRSMEGHGKVREGQGRAGQEGRERERNCRVVNHVRRPRDTFFLARETALDDEILEGGRG